MKKYICCFLLVSILVACGKGNREDVVFLAKLTNAKPSIQVTALQLEPVYLEPIDFSCVGIIEMNMDSIYLIDKRLCRVFLFDKDGKLCKETLGMGQGPQEIATGYISGYSIINPVSHLFIGSANDCHLFDEFFYKQKQFVIDKGPRDRDATYVDPFIYTLSYENLIIKTHGDYLYYNVFSEFEELNFINSPKGYFEKAHYLSMLNLKTGKVEKMLGNYPEIYVNNRGLKQYSQVNFDINSEGNFYISFEADSLIYEYDKDFNPIRSYGYSGKDMHIKEKILATFADFSECYNECRNESGYYRSLTYIDETGLLFRVYKKGEHGRNYGLQIYKGNVLIGDLEVPENFEVLGYSVPYYYATTGIDAESEEPVLIYKFTV